jgi:hypothetical protein
MKLYLLSQDENSGYDTYDSCVVAAKSPAEAIHINPSWCGWGSQSHTWAKSPDKVNCEELGTAKRGTKPGLIISSFNAG